jgi:hypothetical protein
MKSVGKGFLGGISLEKLHEKARGLSYKLGIIRDRLSGVSIAKLPPEYENWYPGKEKVIYEGRIKPAIIKGEAEYFKKPIC